MTKTEMSCQHKVLCEQIHRKNTISVDGFYLECEKIDDYKEDQNPPKKRFTLSQSGRLLKYQAMWLHLHFCSSFGPCCFSCRVPTEAYAQAQSTGLKRI